MSVTPAQLQQWAKDARRRNRSPNVVYLGARARAERISARRKRSYRMGRVIGRGIISGIISGINTNYLIEWRSNSSASVAVDGDCHILWASLP